MSVYNENTKLEDIDDKTYAQDLHEIKEILSRLYPDGSKKWEEIMDAKE